VSQENIDLVRHLFDEWKLGEVDEAEIRSVYHPDVEFLPLRAATEGGYRGIAGIEKFVADTEEVFDKFDFQYELLELGELVLAWGKIHLRAKGSGIAMDTPMGGVFEFRDAKILRWEDFGSKDRALEAVELRE
jgi:ketosteroid isomerase-like protein